MLFSFLKNTGKDVPVDPDDLMQRSARDMIEKSYIRLFSTQDGRRVLTHLCHLTMSRTHGPEASPEQLRFAEGQRALVQTILRFVESGKRKV